MKKVSKILFVIMILMTIALMTFNVNAAVNPNTFTGNSSYNTAGISNLGQNIIQIISVIGSIASVIVLIILGIKYMMGSAEEKAEYKKTMIPYVIGALLIFAATTIVNVLYGMFSAIS